MGSIAVAQTPPEESKEEVQELDEVRVTGSRIIREGYEAPDAGHQHHCDGDQ